MKYCVGDDAAATKMLDHDALEQGRRHAGVPDRIRIHDDYRSSSANAQAGRLASLHPVRPEQQAFPLQ